jgi:poly(beta-D-mannuronate) lyase
MPRLLLVAALLLVAMPASADPLRVPEFMQRASDPHAAAPPPSSCGLPPAPVGGLDVKSVYRSDSAQDRAHYDQVDPKAMAQYQAQVAGLHQYQFELAKRVDLYVETASAARAECVLDWMAPWAAADAMLAPMTLQGRFEQKWHAAGVCLDFLKIGAASGLVPDKLARVRAYLVKLGRAARDGNHADGQPPGSDDVIAHNNHAYWAGLAAAACAIAGDDRPLFDWGASQLRMATGEITPEGMLPLEVQRGSRALGYHAMSLDALTMLAALAEANGRHPWDEAGGALHRLVATTARGYLDPQMFARASGSPQEDNAAFASYYLSWAELYRARFAGQRPMPDIDKILDAHRPVGHRFLGGNVTLMIANAPH